MRTKPKTKFKEKQLAWIVTSPNAKDWVMTSVITVITGEVVYYNLKNLKTSEVYQWVEESLLASYSQFIKAKEEEEEDV